MTREESLTFRKMRIVVIDLESQKSNTTDARCSVNT
jgi:hypothetical protein